MLAYSFVCLLFPDDAAAVVGAMATEAVLVAMMLLKRVGVGVIACVEAVADIEE